jgi:hypothetical protein
MSKTPRFKNKAYQDPYTRWGIYKRRYENAFAVSMQWRPIIEAAQHFCIPSRNIFNYLDNGSAQGQIKNSRVYDTTEMVYFRKFVAKIHDAMTPPQMDWCALKLAGIDVDMLDEETRNQAEEWLGQTTKKLFNSIRNSNFDLIANEFYQDIGIGTAILVINEGSTDDVPFEFHSIPLAQMCFEESVTGKVNSSYRTHLNIKVADIQIMWPNVSLPDYMLKQLAMDPEARVSRVVEGSVYWHGEKLPYCYALWTDQGMLEEEQSKTPNWIVGRWDKTNTDCFGRGVGILALPTIISLNEVYKLEMRAANLNICKPYMAYNDNVFNPFTFNIAANQIITVAPLQGPNQWPIAPLPDVANPEFANLCTADLRNQIAAIMFAGAIGEMQDAPVKTATEVAVRQRSLIEEIGPSFTRLMHELLSPMVDCMLDILERKGIIEQLPGLKLRAQFKSPLVVAQGQKDVDAVIECAQAAAAIIGPDDAAKLFNITKLGPFLRDAKGIKAGILYTEEEMIEQVEQTAQQMSDAMEMEQMASMEGSKEMPPMQEAVGF